METPAHTAPTFSPRTCRRCKGTGHHSFNSINGSMCFGCEGTGTEMVETGRRALTADETARVEAYEAGIAAREAREAARRARRATREGSA